MSWMKTWPAYSPACRKDVDALLKKGGSLSAYRASSAYPDWKGPSRDSWAWKLERLIERTFRVKYAVAVNSGTAALHSALAGMRLDGGEVVTTPYTFSATTAAIVLGGGVPVYADVDPYTFCITKETVRRVLSKRTKAILPVHLFGGMADVRGLASFGLPIIEDACQAVGARNSEGYSATQGHAGAYSFNGGKNCPSGEGGALVTNSEKVWESSRLLVNHGENFGSHSVGYNYRINEVTACIAWHGLKDVDWRNGHRESLAEHFRFWMDQLYINEHRSKCKIWFPTNLPIRSHALYTFPVMLGRTVNRARFIRSVAKSGFQVQAGYTQPLHTLPAFRKYQRCPLPVVEDVHKRLCLLNNVRPPSTSEDMKKMAEAMRKALA